jgi:multidrug efflux pump subunit AcrA (membrane-fusion protein)
VLTGVTTYRVKLLLPSPTGVKPGMTGRADIVFSRRDGVLLVPNRAIRVDGDKRTVGVFDGSKIVPRPVTTGVADDKSTEIVSGLRSGELVAVPTTSTLDIGAAGK